jgi:hypothetical protein
METYVGVEVQLHLDHSTEWLWRLLPQEIFPDPRWALYRPSSLRLHARNEKNLLPGIEPQPYISSYALFIIIIIIM